MRPKTPNITPTTTPMSAPVLNDLEDPPELPVGADPFVESDGSEGDGELVEGEDVEVAAVKQSVSLPVETMNKLDLTIPASSFPV